MLFELQRLGAQRRPDAVPLRDAVEMIRAAGDPRRRPERVDALLANIDIEVRSISRYLRFVEGRYTRNLVYRDDWFEVIVLCWDGGCASPVHGHAGQQCWFVPILGAFDLEDYRIVAGGRAPGPAWVESVAARSGVSAGAIDRRHPEADVHRIAVAPSVPCAVSLNVYARPIDECLVYDVEQGVCASRRLRYDSFGGLI